MIQTRVFRVLLRLFGILVLESIFLLVVLYILSPQEEARALWELILKQGFVDRLGQAFLACLLIGLFAVIAGMPLGFGIADLRRGRRLVFLMLLLFALSPEALRLAFGAFDLETPRVLLLVLAALSWIILLSVLGARAFPGSILASAELCGAPRRAIFTRILLPILLPSCLVCMLGSVLLLMLLEGTLFSLAVFIFEQGNPVFAIFALLFLVLPLCTILIYLFTYTRSFRHAVGT